MAERQLGTMACASFSSQWEKAVLNDDFSVVFRYRGGAEVFMSIVSKGRLPFGTIYYMAHQITIL